MPGRVREFITTFAPPLKAMWGTYKANRLLAMRATLVSRFDLTVQNGPFKGLRYISESSGSALLPKLLGSYEAALHAVLLDLMSNEYDTMIDVGCAEGYYAVGFAYRCPGVPVIAFDANPVARAMCSRLARLNGVADRITVLGECERDALGAAILGRSLIICDCEGGELHLLDPAVVNGLDCCDLIVELHPHVHPLIPRLIEQRFEETHAGAVVYGLAAPARPEELKLFHWFDRPLATYEERSGATPMWTVLRSRRYLDRPCSDRCALTEA